MEVAHQINVICLLLTDIRTISYSIQKLTLMTHKYLNDKFNQS